MQALLRDNKQQVLIGKNMETQTTQLDPQAVNLAKSIRQVETGGDPKAKGASGEFGAYQFLPDTWNKIAPKYGVNVPLEKSTLQDQNKVAYSQIKEWKDAGYKPDAIASMWNSGKPEYQGNVGINSKGVKYDVPAYVASVGKAYQTLKSGGKVGVDPNNPSSTTGTQKASQPNPYGAINPASSDDNLLTGGLKTIENIPSSALNLAKNLGSVILHPLTTTKNIGDVLSGGVENAMDKLGITKALGGIPTDTVEKQKASAVWQGLKDRYGSLDNIRKTVENDPTGFALDVATILEGGGAALKTVGEAGDVSKIAELGQGISDVGSKVNPINVAGKTVGILTKPLKNLSENLTEGILKRTPTMVAKNPELASDLANEGIFAFTRQGYANQLADRMNEVGDAINQVTKGNTKEISTQDIVSKLQPLKEFYANIPGETSSVKAIDQIIDETLAKGKTINVENAQKLKTDIYKNLETSYAQNKGILQSPAITGAQKTLASGLRQELESAVPELSDLNDRYSILKAAKKALDKTIERTTGKGIAGTGIGMYDLLTSLGGSAIGGLPGALKALAGEKLITSTAVLSGTVKLLGLFEKANPAQRLALYSMIAGETGRNINQVVSK